ncbi:type II toxin-antitoxin system RelE family toxin [Lonepinella sp. BR2474]|uniref:type II toxin-antitoxin system RelE family toxin n=1 Tax=Lonepinella sp. BR2474 TaxID=3434548 RepID=UPI003F6DE2EB
MNKIEWKASARKNLSKISNREIRLKIFNTIGLLVDWPNCRLDIKKLQNRSDYRLRVGNYRVIFEIDTQGNPIIITINQVEKRDERTYA